MGFVVLQGYGLTETAPIVTLNHPFKTRKRARSAKPIAGVEVRIADDGEILVRGENVTSGYYGAEPGERRSANRRRGMAAHRRHRRARPEGRLYIKGRKKEMIVTPEGLNVFPEDVERALERAWPVCANPPSSALPVTAKNVFTRSWCSNRGPT